MTDNNQVIIPAVVAIVAVVGMVILFSGQGGTGAFEAVPSGEAHVIPGQTWQHGEEYGLRASQMCPSAQNPEFGECCSMTCAMLAGEDDELQDTCQYHCKQSQG